MYRDIADVLLDGDDFCTINFKKVSYDTTNGSTIYNSLTAGTLRGSARRNSDNQFTTVTIGPYIDMFTSKYVIINQRHILTSSAGQRAKDSESVVSILPEQHSLSVAVATIAKRLKWNNVALLSQDDFSTVLTLGIHGIDVSPIRLPSRIASDEDAELVHNLMGLRASQKDRIILHSSKRDTVTHVMRAIAMSQCQVTGQIAMSQCQATVVGRCSLLKLFVFKDFEDIINDEKSWPGTIFGLQLLREKKVPENVSQIARMRSKTRLEMGLAVDVVGLLRHVLHTKNCRKQPPADDVMIAREFNHTLAKVSPYQGALGQYMWHNRDRSNYSVDILRYRQSLKTVGKCTFSNGTAKIRMKNATVYDRTSGDRQWVEKLRVVARLREPFVMKTFEGKYEGFNVDLLEMISKKVNFTYDIYDVEEGAHINKSDTMVTELLTGNASMAVGDLEVTAETEEVIAFSHTILSTTASILSRRATNTRTYFLFLGPFSMGLWFMILGFIMVAGTALYTMSRFDYTQENSEQRFDLKESMWYSVNVLLQGTTEYSPQTTSMRTIIAFFWFCVLIIDAAYTANLAAYLTLQQIDNRIRTVYDLAGQTELLYGVRMNSNLMTFFENAKEDPYERMWAFMKLEGTLWSDTDMIIQSVKEGKFVFIAEKVVNDYYALGHCELESIEQNFAQKDFSLGFPRGAPYKDDVNRALLSLKEEGKLDTLIKKWWTSRSNCTTDTDTRSVKNKATKELELTHMYGVFMVLGAFVVLALFVEVIERIHMCFEVRRKKKEKDVKEDLQRPTTLSEGFLPQAVDAAVADIDKKEY
ncbi:glutamate receptor ionotropic, kainate 2-like [Haliotis rubra]|uniref:glutamate receptor ionotropic, kainate 2-like n=1 Tax=Haliotis rubra TaxID=36100 RepID=UPI001EE54AC1|nr:glutamate receptor ionotropic, kainate 2-like [Haliotis rubra]